MTEEVAAHTGEVWAMALQQTGKEGDINAGQVTEEVAALTGEVWAMALTADR
jgi:hypothetical protein